MKNKIKFALQSKFVATQTLVKGTEVMKTSQTLVADACNPIVSETEEGG
jgi:hypothetical protein